MAEGDAEARIELDVAYAAYRIAQHAPSGAIQRMRRRKATALQEAKALFAKAEAALRPKMAASVRKAAAAW